MTVRLSKSKLLAFLQCPKRLWLEVHKPELRDVADGIDGRIQDGNEVGAIARELYDPARRGTLIDAQAGDFNQALERCRVQMTSNTPIFEAGFATTDAIAFADIMLPIGDVQPQAWRMVEVKSATGVKAYYLDDAAIQFHVARSAGVPVRSIAVAHIDSSWVYPGGGDYNGLLTEVDVTQEANDRAADVSSWITDAVKIAALNKEPSKTTGAHCSQPFDCSFRTYCASQEPQANHPVSWLPRLQRKATKEFIETKSITEMCDVPDEYLTDIQKRVKAHTISGETYFDAQGAAKALATYALPGYFLDFESTNLAVPIWKGARPYQQVPFQFSLHRLLANGTLDHIEFQDLTGNDPMLPFAQALISSCGTHGPIFVYSRAFEATRIRELADHHPAQRNALLALNERLVDLLPVVANHFYHPSQEGSWSIKKVLPAVAPDLDYARLDGVKDGRMAMAAFQEAIRPSTTTARKEEIRQQLSAYCRLDTFAMVRLWQFLAGRMDLKLEDHH